MPWCLVDPRGGWFPLVGRSLSLLGACQTLPGVLVVVVPTRGGVIRGGISFIFGFQFNVKNQLTFPLIFTQLNRGGPRRPGRVALCFPVSTAAILLLARFKR